jgi:ADP-L-glycero-D-manno-heptose 6-epimerase
MSSLGGRILVTGAAGFIGSALVWALNRRGYEDLIVTDFSDASGNLNFLKYEKYIEANIFSDRIAKDPMTYGRFTTVFHLGACSSTTEMNLAYLAYRNTDYTTQLADWALSQEARFIYASSAATYGDGSQGMDDENDDLSRLHPLNPYGESKHKFDRLAQSRGWLSNIVGLKYFNVFGPNEDHKGNMRSVVNKACGQIHSTGKVQLFKSYRPDYKDGEQRRDFLYVKDAVEMTIHFAEEGAHANGLYNLGSGEANTWLTLAHAVFAALDREPKIEFIEMPETLREQYQYFTQANISKLKGSGYRKSVTPLPEAVRDYVQQYLEPGLRLGQQEAEPLT